MSATLIPLIGFVFIAVVVAAVLSLVSDLAARRRTNSQTSDESQSATLPLVTLPPERVRHGGVFDGFSNWFDRTVAEGEPDTSADAGFLAVVAAGLAVGGIALLVRDSAAAGVASALFGMGLAVAYFVYLRRKRINAMREQLPEVMELMARSVRAGTSIDQAIHLAGDSFNGPLGPEFRRCARQLDMGLSMNAAMRTLTRRVPIVETRILAATLVVQRQAGGSLPVTLERLARVIRDRLSYRRQFRAATAMARFGTVAIVLAAIFVATYMVIWQPEYIQNFMETTRGKIMLVVAIVLQIIGLIWVLRLLRVNY